MEDNSIFIRAFIIVISFIAKLISSDKTKKLFLRDWRPRRILLQFWKVPKGKLKKAYIFYPTYPIERVDRIGESDNYISLEDKEAVDFLKQNLSKWGFACSEKPVQHFDTDHNFPTDGIIILVCGPKLDPTTNQVVNDPSIGGNPVSSWFYQLYHKAMGMNLLHDCNKHKQYHIPIPFPGFKILYSPQDEQPQKNIDRGLLVRFKVGEQFFFLCWGIHGSATLGTAKVALNPAHLATFPLDQPDIMAVVEAEKITSGNVQVKAVGYPLHFPNEAILVYRKTGPI
ncbi:MAG: hypothetical protein QMD03_07765 [Syntrophales bacterium]|nr:hypothetical protein [Syntrophales bacterium]